MPYKSRESESHREFLVVMILLFAGFALGAFSVLCGILLFAGFALY